MTRTHLFGISALIVGTMLVLQRSFGVFAFQWPLFIGGMASMLINGPHGGTTLQQNVGLALNFAINTGIYGAALLAAVSIKARLWRRS